MPNPPPGATEPADEPDELDQLTELALAEMDDDPERWANEIIALEQAVDDEINANGAVEGRLARCAPFRKAVRHDIYRRRMAAESST